jgi:hypothetical protein
VGISHSESVVSTIWDFAVGDYVEVLVKQANDADQNVIRYADHSPEFMAKRIG